MARLVRECGGVRGGMRGGWGGVSVPRRADWPAHPRGALLLWNSPINRDTGSWIFPMGPAEGPYIEGRGLGSESWL